MPCVLTIGNFDGVHTGHQAILQQAKQLAQKAQQGSEDTFGNAQPVRVVVVTFDQHPVALLKPGSQPPALGTLAQRQAWLIEAGADEVVVLHVDEAFLKLSPQAFVEQYVLPHKPICVLEGVDFCFGHQRTGNNQTLAQIGEQEGFQVSIVDGHQQVLSDLKPVQVSSSLVRWLIGQGRVHDAAITLGRAFELTATVVQGEQRGRTIEVPTANWNLDELADFILPANGVYYGIARLQDGATYGAAISVGIKPTFGIKQLTIEAHLLGLPEGTDLYGQPMTLSFDRWIRPQVRFPDLSELVAQIKRDVVTCQQFDDERLA